MQKGLLILLAIWVIALKMATFEPLLGQEFRGMRELLGNPEFQSQFAQDLQINDEQGRQLKAIADEMRTKLQDMFRKNGPMLASPEDREKTFESMREEGIRISGEVDQKLKGILNEKQLVVYRDRTFQMTGGLRGILLNPGFGRTLNMTEEQLRKVNEIQKKLTKEAFALVDKLQNATPEERTIIMQQLQTIGEKGTKMIEQILDDEQKVKVQKLNEEMPDYIWSKLAANRGKSRAWRPGANSWKPGEGAPKNVDLPREERPKSEEGRKFPGQVVESEISPSR